MSKYEFFPYVTPNHFKAADFTEIGSFTLDKEFNLIAPIMLFFEADCSRKDKARQALAKLKRLGHPMMANLTVNEVMAESTTPNGLHSRYNGLMMAIAESEIEGIESYIDEYGAFSFKVGDDSNVLMGDSSGVFAFYEDAAAVRARLREAESELMTA